MVRRFCPVSIAVLGSVMACSFPHPADVNDDGGVVGIDADGDGGTNPDASPRGTVRVTVMDPDPHGLGAPRGGVAIVFVDPDGSVAAVALTDGSGKAQAEVLPGGSVTSVFQASATEYRMNSVLAVNPGDELVIDPIPDQSPAGTFTVMYPSYPNAVFYCAQGPCDGSCTGGGFAPIQLTFSQYCATSTMTIAVTAHTNLGFAFASYQDLADVTYASGGVVQLSGSWPALANMDATLRNVPTDVASQTVTRFAPTRSGRATIFSDGTPTNGTVTVSAAVAQSSSAVMETYLSRNTGARQYIDEVVAGSAVPYTLDVAAYALPWLNPPSLATDSGEVSVPISGSGEGDVFQAKVAYTRTVAQNTTSFYWTVVMAAPTNFTLPKLPASVGDVNPRAGDVAVGVGNKAAAILVDSNAVGGYDAARGRAFDLVNAWQTGAEAPGVMQTNRWPQGTTLFRVSAR